VTTTRHVSLDALSRFTSVSIVVVVVGSAIEAALLFARVAAIDRRSGLLARLRLATEGNGLVDALALAISVIELCVLAGWLAWQYRASSTLHAGATVPRYRPQWSVLWWFVPVAQLWMPGATNADLWRVSHRSASGSWPVWIWWTAFLVGWIARTSGHILRQVVLGSSAIWIEPPRPFPFSADEVVDGVRVGSVIAGIGAIGLVLAGALAIVVLSRVTKRISEVEPAEAPVRPDV
jgi:hypothetical protein